MKYIEDWREVSLAAAMALIYYKERCRQIDEEIDKYNVALEILSEESITYKDFMSALREK